MANESKPKPSATSVNENVRLTPSDVMATDRVRSAASTLAGVGEALYFRAIAEDDDMLAMLAAVIDSQVDALRNWDASGRGKRPAR